MIRWWRSFICLLLCVLWGQAFGHDASDMAAILGFSGNAVHAAGHSGVFKGVRGAETMVVHGRWLSKKRHLITHKDLIGLHAQVAAAKHPLVALIAGRHSAVSGLMAELSAKNSAGKMLHHKLQGNEAVFRGLNQRSFITKQGPLARKQSLLHAVGALQAAAGVHLEANDTLTALTVFSGQVQSCDRPIALPITQSCCAKMLRHHTMAVNHCPASAYQLAAARRVGRAHYIGSYCRHAIPYGLTKQCIYQRAVYCVFSSAMARHLQETGRRQLQQGQGAREAQIVWPLWSDQPHWNHYEINGIQLATWSNRPVNLSLFPVQLTINKQLQLVAGQTRRIPGMQLSVACQAHHCQGTVVAHSMVKPIALNHYRKTYLGSSWIKQQVCPVAQGKQPSSYCFLLHSVITDFIQLPMIDWYQQPDFHLVGYGQCSDEICQLQINYHKQRLSWLVPTRCILARKHRLSLATGISLVRYCLVDPVIFAVCPLGRACGPLPKSPYDFVAQSVNGWRRQDFALSQSTWHGIGAGIKVKGQCVPTTRQCRWSLHWMPLTTGAKYSVDEPISWAMFLHDKQAKLVTASGITVRPFVKKVTAGGISSSSAVIHLSTAGGDNYRFSLPLAIPRHHPLSFAAGDLALKIWGGCNLASGRCDYHLVHAVPLATMPWGSARHPHCQGFSPTAFHWLDLSHFPWQHYIDLGGVNWHKTVPKISTAHPLSPNPNRQGLQVIQLTPSEGYGPFDVKALFAAQLINGAMVNAIHVDWGDGDMAVLTENARVTHQGHAFFQATHRYQQPTQHARVVEVIHAVFYSTQGRFSAQAKVVNSWQTPLANQPSGQGFLQEVKAPHD